SSLPAAAYREAALSAPRTSSARARPPIRKRPTTWPPRFTRPWAFRSRLSGATPASGRTRFTRGKRWEHFSANADWSRNPDSGVAERIFVPTPTSPNRQLRELLNKPGVIRSLGAHDVFTARLIETAGLETVFIGGFGTSASMLGLPDVGFLTLTE